jgi:hypothetical protein
MPQDGIAGGQRQVPTTRIWAPPSDTKAGKGSHVEEASPASSGAFFEAIPRN